MASEWKEVAIEEIASKIAMGPFGSDIKTDNFVPSGVPVIRGGNLAAGQRFHGENFVFLTEKKADELANANAFPGDIVFTHRGTLGQVGLIPERPFKRYVVSQSQLKLTCDRSVAHPGFIYYFFKSPAGQHALLMNMSQTGVPAISRPVTSLKSVRLLLPSLREQQAIARILGAFDDKIELNRRVNKTLDAIAQALFSSWFVDFDPVRAKAENRNTGLPKQLAELFPDSFQDSELGEIPKGWLVRSVEEIAEINSYTLSRTDRLARIDYIEINKVMQGEIEAVAHYDRGQEPSRARRRLRHGDTVLSTVRPDRGAHFLCLNPTETLIASTGFAVLTPRNGCWAFLYSALTRREISEALGRLAEGGAYPAVRPEAIGGLDVVVPPTLDCISAFEKLARPLLERSAKCRIESRALANLRDLLLPKLVSGEMRLDDGEGIVGGVL